MKISTKGRYALRMLLDLAEHRGEGFISLKEIATRQNISKLYLEQIVALLNTSNLLRTNRGKHGGYMLARKPSECTVKEILMITEGSLAPVACLDADVNLCDQAGFCKTLIMWTGLKEAIANYLGGITLQDMLEQYQEMGANNYVI